MPQIEQQSTPLQTNSFFKDLTAVVEYAAVAIFSVSLNKEVTSWNSAAERIFGYTAEEIIGQPVGILIPDDFANETRELAYKVLNGSTISDVETIRINKDGKNIPVSTSISPIMNTEGKVKGFSVIVRAISWKDYYRQRIADNEKLLSSIFSSIHDGLIVIDKTYTIVKSNKAFGKLLETKTDEVIGKKCFKVFFGNSSPCGDCPFFVCLRTLKPAQKLIQRQTASGQDRYLDILHSPLISSEAKGPDGVIVSVRDVTAEKQLEHEMTRLAGLGLVGEMAASIGHEVRNPMTTVRGFLQMLGKKDAYQADREFFQLMIDELDRANQIIAQFLSLARNKKVDIQPNNINTIIESLGPLITADAMETGHQILFKLKPVPDTLLDKNEVHQMVLNLVRNGLEAMPLGGTLTIQTRFAKGQPILTIRDQGVGVPTEILKRLGTPFVTTKDNGTGLGLAVCYSIAERNNAKIRVKTSDKGTEFEIRFCSLSAAV